MSIVSAVRSLRLIIGYTVRPADCMWFVEELWDDREYVRRFIPLWNILIDSDEMRDNFDVRQFISAFTPPSSPVWVPGL